MFSKHSFEIRGKNKGDFLIHPPSPLRSKMVGPWSTCFEGTEPLPSDMTTWVYKGFLHQQEALSSLYSCARIRKLYGLFLTGHAPFPPQWILRDTYFTISQKHIETCLLCSLWIFNWLIPDHIYTRVSQAVTSFCYMYIWKITFKSHFFQF